jgi:TPR repeat protein
MQPGCRTLPTVLRQRIELSQAVERRDRDQFTRACARVRFDAVAIDARLADAAAAGHEASLWEIGRRSDDRELRHKHWLSAAMLGYVPAQVGLAEILMAESLQGDRRNRGRMNFWLEAAAKQSPRALFLLGECRLEGCNAQPPDAESAVPLLRDAAMQGQVGALAALASIPRGEPAAPTDAELFSLHAFHNQLNELGCFGADPYGRLAVENGRVIKELGSRMSPHGLEEARTLAAQFWREHAPRARHIQGCD